MAIEQLAEINTRPVVSEQLVHIDMQDERVQDVVNRICMSIRQVHSDAEFVSYIGTNPLGIYIEVYTEQNDLHDILQVLDEKMGNMHVAAGVNVCVLPRKKAKAQAA